VYQLKSVTARVTDQDNATVLANIPSERPDDPTLPYLKAVPSFPARVNGGYGECVLDLGGYGFDSFAEGTVVNHMNVVDLYANVVNSDTMAQASARVYRGFVSAYSPYTQGGDEGVKVTCLGLASLLTASKYGTSPAYSVSHASEDPEFIAKDVIDGFNATFGGSLLSYAGTTSTVGTSVTKDFTDLSWFDAIGEAIKLAGPGWYWHIDQFGQFYFRAKPVAALHTFTVNLDIESGEFLKTAEKVRNEIVVARAGGTRTSYTDAASQAAYGTGNPPTGRWTDVINDSTLGDSTTADQAGNKALGDEKSAAVSGGLVVNRQYPIDTIKAGDACRIANFKSANTFFGTNVLQIAALTWQGDTIRLELEQQQSSLARELTDFVNA
jgi:hypothetical protein